MNEKPKTNSVNALTALVDIRRDIESLLHRVDAVLTTFGDIPRGARLPQVPVTQTYPQGYDHRGNPEALRAALVALYDRVSKVDTHRDAFGDGVGFYEEVCLRAAEARLYQVQTVENSREWETAVGVIRALTRIVSDTKPGFVYGLASSHNTDWGKKISDLLDVYTPIGLE